MRISPQKNNSKSITKKITGKQTMETHSYNLEIERTILVSFIHNPQQAEKYFNLNADIFFLPNHRDIFIAIKELNTAQIPVDEEFIKRNLVKKNLFEENILLEILIQNPVFNLEFYIQELQNLHIKRETAKLIYSFQNGSIELKEFKSSLHIIENLYKKEVQEEEKKEIDFKKLTPFLEMLVKDLIEVNNYPATMVLSTVLASMSGLIGARAKITNNVNVTVFPVVWSVIVAPSSLSAKSTLFKFTKKAIFGDIQKELFDKYEEDMQEYKEELKSFASLSKDEKAQQKEPEKPSPKLLIFAGDGTAEAKIVNLARNQNGGVVYFDEMKSELERTNADTRYKALKTSIFDGELYHKELVSNTFILKNPVLSEVGLITENWLIESIQKNDLASGFLARYLFSYNKREDFKPLEIKENLSNFEKYADVGEFVLNMLEIDRKEPLLFRLSEEAKIYYINWFNDLSKTAFATETDEEITASYRLTTYALKFTLILYIFNNAFKKLDVVSSNFFSIGIEYLQAGIYVMELFREENSKILELFNKNKKLNAEIDTVVTKLQKKIKATKEKQITRTDALNGIRGLNAKKLDSLIEQNFFKVFERDRTIFISEHS